MMNSENLSPLVEQKKRKRNRSKGQQQPAFVPWRNPLLIHPSANPQTQQVQKSYQAPHHQQESLDDLVDDTSPTLLVETGTETQESAEGEEQPGKPFKVTPTRQEKWLKFQQSLQRSLDEKADSKDNEETEIHWDQNPSGERQEMKSQAASSRAGNSGLKQGQDSLAASNQMTNPDETRSPNPRFYTKKQNSINSLSTYAGFPAGIPRSFLKTNPNFGALYLGANGQNVPGYTEPTNPTVAYDSRGHVNPMHVQINNTEHSALQPQQYSPSDNYEEGNLTEDPKEGSASPEDVGQKRLSAFERLGPQTQPKKPKLTINLLFNKDESVREVLDETPEEEDKNAPVHLRADIVNSSDEIVTRFLPSWPWKRKVTCRRSVSARSSKSVMMMEQEQMEECYDKENAFIQVSLKGYPPNWSKEQVMDAVLESVKGKSFIPSFIEFTPQECKFLVIRVRPALTALHKLGLMVRADDVELAVTLGAPLLTLNQIDFIPRLVLRKLLAQGYDSESTLSLKEFSLKPDVSHFIYFPLNRVCNQSELVQLQSSVSWNYLTHLDLSHNRITSLEGFSLPTTTPRLRNLDLSCNQLERATDLLRLRALPLRALALDGNPLCRDHTRPADYVRVLRMMFPGLAELDGVPIHLKGELPQFVRNYSPHGASALAGGFLEVFFPLLDAPPDQRGRVASLYRDDAVLTLTYRQKLRHGAQYRNFRNVFLRARQFDEGGTDCVEGAASIAKLISKWPAFRHDPHTFTVDVMHHEESSMILRVSGIVKLVAETLADDEQLLAFTRTVALVCEDDEYKIRHEMLCWDKLTQEYADSAFKINLVPSKPLSLKLESPPDAELKEKLIEIFTEITDLEKMLSERCLEAKEWNLKSALEYFKTMVQQDNFDELKN